MYIQDLVFKNQPTNQPTNQDFLFYISKVKLATVSRGRLEGYFFNSYHTEVPFTNPPLGQDMTQGQFLSGV